MTRARRNRTIRGRLVGVLAAGATVAGGAALAAAPAGAATLTVCASGCGYTSIGAAVTAAAAGDTVTVAAGTYNETQVLITKPLNLVGAGAATTIIDGGSITTLATDGTLRVNVPAGAVDVSGFTIRNAGRKASASSYRFGAVVKSTNATPGPVTFDGLAIEGYGTLANKDYGILVDGTPTVDEPAFTLSNSAVSNTWAHNLLAEDWKGALTLSGNTLQQAKVPSPVAAAVYVHDGTAGRSNGPDTISGNTFTGHGIVVTTYAAASGGFESLAVTGNRFNALTAGTIGTTIAGAPGFASASISGNTYTGAGPAVASTGVALQSTTGTVAVTDNRFTGTGTTINVSVGAATFNRNRLSGNGVGLRANSGTSVDASTNWWGCNQGPSATPPCVPKAGVGTPTIADWIVADLIATPSTVPSLGTSSLAVSLDQTNLGAPVTIGSAFAGTPVTYAAGSGSIAAPSGVLTAGVAPAKTYTAPLGPLVDPVTATVDGYPVSTPITVLRPTIGLSGHVTSTADGSPIAGIQVRAYKNGATTDSTATATDANGNWWLPKVGPGQYRLWFRDVPGSTWFSEYHSDKATLATADAVEVTTGNATVVDAQLVPKTPPAPVTYGAVAGTVRTVGGAGIGGIQVRLIGAPYTGAGAAATTAPDGTYSFTSVRSGPYKLWFRDVAGATWISEYHSDKSTLAAADEVVVTANATSTVDAVLAATETPTTAPAGTITGTVTASDGLTPIAGIQVRLYPAVGGSSAATTDAAGRYTFANRPTGTYRLWFRDVAGKTWVSEYHQDKATLAEADPIVLAEVGAVVDASLLAVGETSPNP